MRNCNLSYTFTTSSPSETKALAKCLAKHVFAGGVIVLNGTIGAGKTNFTQGFAAGLNINCDIKSPTFNILFEYNTGTLPLYHFDLYRLENEADLEDIGFYEAVEGGGVSVIEWGDKFPSAMPADWLEITFSVLPNEKREITFSPHGKLSEELLRTFLADENVSNNN